jgi:diaminopimelate epimerase
MTAATTLKLLKMNGLGNEIVVADLRGTKQRIAGDAARRIAEVPRTRFDQMMVLYDARTKGSQAFATIFNADGSEAMACGNGMRCVAWLLARNGAGATPMIETKPGVLACEVHPDGRVTVDMGEPRFEWQAIPLVEAFHDTRGIELQVGPIDAPLIHSPSVVNVGNPHCVFWVDRLDVVDLGRVGPMLEHHRLFPDRANISLARVDSREAITLLTWERGAGLTKACGTAACAATVCAARKKLTDRRVTVTLPGGPLEIEWRADNRIMMTGPVELEYEVPLDPALLQG